MMTSSILRIVRAPTNDFAKIGLVYETMLVLWMMSLKCHLFGTLGWLS